MTTLSADVRPAKIAPTPFNDNVPCWTADRRARLLLASIAARPPMLTCGDVHRGAEDGFAAYSGYRAAALHAVRMEHGLGLLRSCRLGGELGVAGYEAWSRQPTATQAIDAAVGSC